MKRRKLPENDTSELMTLLLRLWRQYHKLAGPNDKLQTREFRSVVEKITGQFEQYQQGLPIEFDDNRHALGAYLLYFVPIFYQETLSVLSELSQKPSKVLDLGAGCGPNSLAALKHGADEVLALDWNMEALEKAAQICGYSGYTLTTRRWDLFDPIYSDDKFDLIIAGHRLMEQMHDWKAEEKVKFFDRLKSKLTDGGHIVVITSSWPAVNAGFLEFRDFVVQKGFSIVAPCIWQDMCPARQSNTVCYAQRERQTPYIMAEIQRSAQINLGSLKMSYLIFSNKDHKIANEEGFEWYRVVSPPFKTHGGQLYHLCGSQGKKELALRTKEDSKPALIFNNLRRGDVVEVHSQEEKTIEVNSNSHLKHVASVQRPVPRI